MVERSAPQCESDIRRQRTGRVAIAVAAVAMTAIAAFRLPVEFRRLVLEPTGTFAASDVRMRHDEVTAWFAGARVYGGIESADYPPASYLLLRPLAGFQDFDVVRAVWALTTGAALAWLGVLFDRECRATGRAERFLVAVTPLASYATAATIRIGQIGLHILPLLVFACVTLARGRRSWGRDLLAAVAFVAALCKPTTSAPFFWVALALGGIRTGVLIVAGYVAVTMTSATFQPDDLRTLIRSWLGQSSHIEFATAHANVHTWLGMAGLDGWLLAASLTILGAFGGWT
jgi:Glycosyltransferase family 87